jgi:hypothetical protein
MKQGTKYDLIEIKENEGRWKGIYQLKVVTQH